MQYTRFTSEKSEPEEIIDLHKLFLEILETKKIRVNINSRDIIRIEKAPKIKSKRFYLDQIFKNLISNSLKYRPKDKDLIIDIQSKETSHGYEITVRDNGIGFNGEKYGDEVFNPFMRLHAHSQIPGTGLGLTIVKKSVKELKGTVKIISQEGKGTSVTITLPRMS